MIVGRRKDAAPDDYPIIDNFVEDSFAHIQDGLDIGHSIIRLNGVDLKGLGKREVHDMFREIEPGQEVALAMEKTRLRLANSKSSIASMASVGAASSPEHGGDGRSGLAEDDEEDLLEDMDIGLFGGKKASVRRGGRGRGKGSRGGRDGSGGAAANIAEDDFGDDPFETTDYDNVAMAGANVVQQTEPRGFKKRHGVSVYNGFGDAVDDDADDATDAQPAVPPSPSPDAAVAEVPKSKGFRRKPSVYLGFDAGAVEDDADVDVGAEIAEESFEEAEYAVAAPHLVEDVALQCVDCLESKTDGIVDEVDGSWHCGACVAERDAAAAAAPTAADGRGGGVGGDVEGYEVIDPDDEEAEDGAGRRSSIARSVQRQHSLDLAADEAAAIAADVLEAVTPSMPTEAELKTKAKEQAEAQAEIETAEAAAKSDEMAVFKTGARFLGVVAVLEDEGEPVCNAAVDDLKATIAANGGVVVRGTLCLSSAIIEIREPPDGFGNENVLHTINPAVRIYKIALF